MNESKDENSISNNNESESNLNERSTNNNNDTTTIKGKIYNLEKVFDDLYDQIILSKDEILRLLKERELYDNILEDSTSKDKNELLKDLEVVMKDMDGYFDKQKRENEELQLKIARLKTQKTVLQGKFIALQRRISNLEAQVGSDEINFD